jgi:hypothetical protein
VDEGVQSNSKGCVTRLSSLNGLTHGRRSSYKNGSCQDLKGQEVREGLDCDRKLCDQAAARDPSGQDLDFEHSILS